MFNDIFTIREVCIYAQRLQRLMLSELSVNKAPREYVSVDLSCYQQHWMDAGRYMHIYLRSRMLTLIL